MTIDATRESDHSDRSGFERFISALERFGLNVARLLLGVTITAAVFAFLLGVMALGFEGVQYERATSAGKYSVGSIAFDPQFSNVMLNKSPQTNADAPINVDRAAAALKKREDLISGRLAMAQEFGVCFGGGGDNCHDLAYQRKAVDAGWKTNRIHSSMSDGSPVSYSKDLEFADLSPYYGSYGFGNETEALKAEWDAVNSCLASYKSKNGNLYVQKSPELFGAIEAQCDHDYNAALQSELNTRPKDWTLIDGAQVLYLVWSVVGLGSAIILIALTILFFRLEVSFRALRNLNRLD